MEVPPRFREFGPHGPYELIGYGGDQLVYRHPYFAQLAEESLDGSEPGVVSKLSCTSIREGNTGQPDADKQHLMQELDALQQRQARIRRIFDPDAVPWQESQVVQVWLGPKETAFVWGEESPPQENGEFWAVETLQDVIPQLLEPSQAVGLGLGYAERFAVQATPEVYSAVNTRWLQQSDQRPSPYDFVDFLKVHGKPEVEQFLKHVMGDKLAAAALGRFIKGCITYTQETGEILDLVGNNNVIFLDRGHYTLVDVLAARMPPIAHQLPGILQKVQDQEGLKFREMNRLLNGLGHLRFVNFMAAWLDLPERLEPLQGMEADERLWPQVQKILHTSPRMSELRRPTEVRHNANSP